MLKHHASHIYPLSPLPLSMDGVSHHYHFRWMASLTTTAFGGWRLSPLQAQLEMAPALGETPAPYIADMLAHIAPYNTGYVHIPPSPSPSPSPPAPPSPPSPPLNCSTGGKFTVVQDSRCHDDYNMQHGSKWTEECCRHDACSLCSMNSFSNPKSRHTAQWKSTASMTALYREIGSSRMVHHCPDSCRHTCIHVTMSLQGTVCTRPNVRVLHLLPVHRSLWLHRRSIVLEIQSGVLVHPRSGARFDRNLHSRMPLVPTPALKQACM
jgi:hypothetical protein